MIRSAEIIAIGTEILLGDIINTNASHLARGLATVGINTYHQQVVGDNPERLKEALKEAYSRADLVITSGGLGPTEDDLSKEMGAEYFGVPLEMDEIARKHIEDYMTARGRRVTENNWKQATLPRGCQPLYNDNGTAPGFILEKDGKVLIMLPGPPSEIVPMFDDQVMPYLRSQSDSILFSRTLHIVGLGESLVESYLHDQMLVMENPTLAPYAKEGIVDLRITAKTKDEETARQMIAPVEKQIRELFGDAVFGADQDTLEGVVLQKLCQQGLRLATVEGETGGLFSTKLSPNPVYAGGLVLSSREALTKFLGEDIIRDFIPEFSWVAEKLALRVREVMGTEVSLVILGSGGAMEKDLGLMVEGKEAPYGTFAYGLAYKDKVMTNVARYVRRAASNRDFSLIFALTMLQNEILSVNK